jgi:hypothetical protein
MGACVGTLGYGGVSCPPETPGMKQFAYLANLGEIASWTAGTEGIYTNFTMDAGKGLLRFEIKKDSGIFRETLEGGDQDLGSYNQEYEAMIASLSTDARNFVDNTNGPDFVVFAPTKNGRVFVLGKDIGAKLVENEASSEQDGYGERILFRATQMPQKRFELLDTDTDTTIALLEAKVVAS